MQAMRFRLLMLSLLMGLVAAGCQTAPSSRIEPARPLPLGEPVYLLKPSDFPLSDIIAILAPPTVALPKTGPEITVREVGPGGTTAPQLHASSRRAYEEILAEIPPHLPRRAIFLISSRGEVVEVVFSRARDRLNERLFAARLRSLRFNPALQGATPIAVVVAIDLVVAGKTSNPPPLAPGRG